MQFTHTKHFRYFKFLLIISILIVHSFPLYAQNTHQLSPSKNLWLSMNFGQVFLNSKSFYGDFSLEYSNKKSIYSAQYFGLFNLSSSVPYNSSNDSNNFDAIDLLYGRIHRYSNFKISYSTGISFIIIPVTKIKGDVVMKDTVLKVGLPVSFQIVFTPIRLIGIGIKAFANVNSEDSFFGTSVGLYVGKVK